MECSAIYHGIDKRYAYALEKDKFLFRIRTKREDIYRITMHYQDKYMPVSLKDTREHVDMEKIASDEFCDYFEVVIRMNVGVLSYYFELEDQEGTIVYYGDRQFFEYPIEETSAMFCCPQILREEERFIIPEWARNKVVYQIFPSRFASNAPVNEQLWYRTPMGAEEKLGGNIRGIIQKLDYICELGVEVLYINPIFTSDSSHKFDTVDYYQIDPDFGTNEDFRELVRQAHKRGLRVVLDIVFHHTSTKFFAFADVREKGKESRYYNWYYVYGSPHPAHWESVPNYKCYGYVSGMPKLNLTNPEVERYCIDVACYWIRHFDIDGWRLNVGDQVNHNFWKKLRTAVKAEKPDVLLVGEVWNMLCDFLEGDEWDTIVNYSFYRSIYSYVAKGDISPSDLMDRLDRVKAFVHRGVLNCLWNLIDSHDTERFLNSCGGNKEKMKLGVALQFLLPGCAVIYYGDEIGMQGGTDPDCRRGMIWKESMQDKELLEWYKTMSAIRKKYPSILNGNFVNCRIAEEENLIALISESLTERVTTIFHGSDGDIDVEEYAGVLDAITGAPFDGKIHSYQTVVLVEPLI